MLRLRVGRTVAAADWRHRPPRGVMDETGIKSVMISLVRICSLTALFCKRHCQLHAMRRHVSGMQRRPYGRQELGGTEDAKAKVDLHEELSVKLSRQNLKSLQPSLS